MSLRSWCYALALLMALASRAQGQVLQPNALSPPTGTANGGTGSSVTPTAGQVAIGNAGGTAYAPVTMSADCTVTSAGVMSCLKRTFWGGSSNAVVSTSAANVFPAMGNGTAVATTSEGTVTQTVPLAGTAKKLDCRLTNAAGTLTAAGGTNYVVALRQNLATSALTCTIATAATNCQDASDTVTLVAGDQLAFIDTPSGTPTALIVHCSMEVDT